MSVKKFTTIWASIISVLVIVALVANYVFLGPLNTVMNMYFGKGEVVLDKSAEGSLDSEYYELEHTDAESLLQASKDKAVEIENEGIVLLKNDNNALPLNTDEKSISLFGRTSVDPIYNGTGSGSTDTVSVDFKTALENQGFEVNPTLYDFYANHPISTTEITEALATGQGSTDVTYTGRGLISHQGSSAFVNDAIAEVPVSDYPADLTNSYTTYGDAAVVFIGRSGGEGTDLPTNMADLAVRDEDKDKTYLELNSMEQEMLAYVKQQKDAGVFSKIVVVLNTNNTLELDFLNDEAYGIDAAMWVGAVGDDGATAIAQTLDGTNNPSGRTVDTFVSDLTKDPSFENFGVNFYRNVDTSVGGAATGSFIEYEEGIYVGYRYYETAAAEAAAGNYEGFNYDEAVVYPFGYGLSYTDFETVYDGTPTYDNGEYTFDVKVTNTGDVAGKEVVEIFVETPYITGGIEKSKVVLAAFDKTDVIEPGESETVEITVNEEDIASYDYKNNGAYMLDAGEYKFYLSDNAHSWNELDAADSTKVFTNEIDEVVYNEDNGRTSDLVTATNQFDDVSSVFVDTATEGEPLNMSRADFAGTFPTAPTDADMQANDEIKAALELAFDPETNELLGNGSDSLVYTEEMPTTGADNGLSLVSLRGVDYDDPSWDLLLDQLDMEEVQTMLSMAGYNTAEMLSIGKTATLDYDGPMGWSTWVSATGADAVVNGFPAQEVLAATWNVELAEDMGEFIGEQGLYNGFNGWYAPAMNTHRNAFAGRNFEYYSEDGLLAGKMGAATVSGTMEYGVYSYIKHFALNDKEDTRNGISTFANEQAIREIYLKPFEETVKEGKATISYNDENGEMTEKEIGAATAVMSSFNRIGTTWSGGSYSLLTEVLRNEWGFNGAVLTDYYAGLPYMGSDIAVRAGNDLLLNTFADGSLKDSESATAVNAMRNAAHGTLYMVANSNAMQGVAADVTVTYALSTWEKVMYFADVVVGLIALLGIYLIIKKRKSTTPEITE